MFNNSNFAIINIQKDLSTNLLLKKIDIHIFIIDLISDFFISFG
jgi:hypothetical protein